MLTKDNTVKLADFGFSKKLLTRSGVLHTFGGTLQYTSPEQSKGRVYKDQLQEQYSTYRANTDIWLELISEIIVSLIILLNKLDIILSKRSLGCVLYELIHLKLAFPQGLENDDTPIPLLRTSGRFSDILQK